MTVNLFLAYTMPVATVTTNDPGAGGGPSVLDLLHREFRRFLGPEHHLDSPNDDTSDLDSSSPSEASSSSSPPRPDLPLGLQMASVYFERDRALSLARPQRRVLPVRVPRASSSPPSSPGSDRDPAEEPGLPRFPPEDDPETAEGVTASATASAPPDQREEAKEEEMKEVRRSGSGLSFFPVVCPCPTVPLVPFGKKDALPLFQTSNHSEVILLRIH